MNNLKKICQCKELKNEITFQSFFKQCSFLGRTVSEVTLFRKDHLEKHCFHKPLQKNILLCLEGPSLFKQPWVFHMSAVYQQLPTMALGEASILKL